jgi:Rrf2 family protein
MLQMPKKMLYALEAVVDVAYNARPEPVQSKDITQRQGIPQRYLEQVMQQLVRAGILKGVRGPRGGYTLARERRRITVGEVIRVIEAADEDLQDDDSTMSDLGQRVVRPLWHQVRDDAMERLNKINLEDLCREARQCGIKNAAPERHDFTI